MVAASTFKKTPPTSEYRGTGEKNSSPLVSIQGLTFIRESHAIFRGFDLNIEAGEWLHLRGANGSGKSTLMKLMMGQLTPDSGTIHTSPFVYLGHQDALRDDLTVAQHWRLAAQYLNSPLSPDQLLLKTTLGPTFSALMDMPISELSAGLRRQVALAQVFLSPHKLWLLDEPLEHLDREARDHFLGLFYDHVLAGGALCMSGHAPLHPQLGAVELALQRMGRGRP